MMIVRCESCGKKYRVNLSVMSSEKGKFDCHNCKTPIYFSKPSLEASFDVNSDMPRMPLDLDPEESTSQEDSSDKSSSRKKEDEFRNKKKWRFGVVQRLSLIMVVIGLIPIIGFGLFSLHQTNRFLEDKIINERGEAIQSLAVNVDEWIDKNVRALRALSAMPDLQAMQSEFHKPLLQAVQEAYPWMYLVFTLDMKGQNVSRSDQEPLLDYSDREYFKEILSGENLSWQTLIGKTSRKPSMVLSVPIKKDDKLIGVLAAAMTTDELSKNVATWKKGKTGLAFLVDEKGKVIAHRQKEFVIEEKNLSDHPLIVSFKKGETGNISFKKEEDGEAYIGVAFQTAYGWTLAMEESKREAYSALRTTRTVGLAILVVTIVCVILINVGLGRTITRPIRALTHAADQISLGELDVDIPVDRNDEIGDLAEAINRMKDSISLSIKRLKRCRVR